MGKLRTDIGLTREVNITQVSKSFLVNFLMALLFIPIGVWYLLKWTIKGIILLVLTIQNSVKQ
nr:MAG TPA: hypothetical protein [Caudoviricetes sp.]